MLTEKEVRRKVRELLDDEDTIKICKKATKKFNGFLSQEEIDSCVMLALWRSVRNFDPELGLKFTSYLWNGVVFECKYCMKFNRAPSRKYVGVTFNSELMTKTLRSREDRAARSDSDSKELREEIMTCEDPDLLFDRYFNNMSVSELAKQRGVARREINKKLEKMLNYLNVRLS